MQVKEIPINDLKFSEYNPRQATEKEFEDLKRSILTFGIVDPIIVNSAPNRKNVVIGGHFRVNVCKQIGIDTVPVVYVNIPELEREQELNLRLNKNLGRWDWDLLANFDEELLKEVGFESGELDTIFGLDIDEEFDIDKEIDKLLEGEEKRVKDNDLWELGNHKLIIGDCTKRENWEKLLGNETFDFMFTDPPYKLDYAKRAKLGKAEGFGYMRLRKYIGLEERGIPEYNEWLSIADKFQNPQGANIMIFENWSNIVELWQAIEKYWSIKNMIIWHLPNRHQGWGRPYSFFNKYDIAPLAGEGELNESYEEELENYLKEKGQKLLDTYELGIYGKRKKAYWDRRKETPWAKVSDHITWAAVTEASGGQKVVFGTKPIQILVPYIKILCPREGIVEDPFAGSGSTLVGCEIMKRKCRAMEIEPIYGEVILKRWERLTGQKAVKING